MATMLSIPLPPRTPLIHHRRRPFSPSDSHLAVIQPPLHRTATLCASTAQSTPYPSVAEDASPPLSPPVDEISVEAQTEAAGAEDLQFRGCKTCGKEETERGCNGEGRIQGGIATVPGFGWWPIKAYRPCPGFVASGGRYRRKGQSMDEVASGRAKRGTSGESLTKAKSSKRKK